MDESKNSKLITSFLPKGRGLELVKAVKEETGISTGNVSSHRGTGTSSNSAFGEWVEVDVFDVDVFDVEELVDILLSLFNLF